MPKQNRKQVWMPLRRLGQVVSGLRGPSSAPAAEPEDENPWFRLARASNLSHDRLEQSKSIVVQSVPISEPPHKEARWAGDGVSPYGFSDEDGTLKQLDSPNWRRLLPAVKKQRFVPVTSRWQPPQSPVTGSSSAKNGSTWVLQSVFAVALVALGLYAAQGQSTLATTLQRTYRSVFSQDYSGTVIPVVESFLSSHHLSLPAWATPGAIRLHVPVTGLVVTDYTPEHPEMVIQGTSNESVLASGSGVVTQVQPLSSGSLVIIDHGQLGVSIYAGVGTVAVHKGEYVATGQVLGHLPTAVRPTLRFSIEVKGKYVNPHDYIHFPATGV